MIMTTVIGRRIAKRQDSLRIHAHLGPGIEHFFIIMRGSGMLPGDKIYGGDVPDECGQ